MGGEPGKYCSVDVGLPPFMTMGDPYLAIISNSDAARLAGVGPPDMGILLAGCWEGGGLAGRYWIVFGALGWMCTLALPTELLG